MDIKSWIKAARLHAGLTQTQLGEPLNVSKGNVSAWEKGRHEPSFDQLVRIAEITRYQEPLPGMNGSPQVAEPPVHWPLPAIPRGRIEALAKDPTKLERLQGAIALALEQIERDILVTAERLPQRAGFFDSSKVEDPFFSDPTGLAAAPATSYAEYAAQPTRAPVIRGAAGVVVNVAPAEPQAANDKFERVPELGDVRLAAGEGFENDGEGETGFVQFRRSFLQAVGASAKHAKVVYAKGDSMEPIIQDGAALLVLPDAGLTVHDIKPGGVWAINYDGKMIVKSIFKDRHSGRWLARSFNSKYPDIDLEAGESVRVLGRVVWAGAKMPEIGAEQWVRR